MPEFNETDCACCADIPHTSEPQLCERCDALDCHHEGIEPQCRSHIGDDSRGIYLPQHIARQYRDVFPASLSDPLLRGPCGEIDLDNDYWEAWADVLDGGPWGRCQINGRDCDIYLVDDGGVFEEYQLAETAA